jgi:glutamate---cysteine ligase / carboxylate-amine ligase
MEQNFGKSAPFSLGVEEEFQILNRESYELVSRIDEILLAFEGGEKEKRIKAELLQSVVEVATDVAGTVGEAMEDLRDLRLHLRDVAGEADALIASAGTHPFSRYEHQEVTDRPRYIDLIESMRWVAERELIFGLHIHVGLNSPDKAIACANALRTYLPELLALSTNSPFWQARATGLASTRVKVFEPFPRAGLPPAFASYEEFELLVERGIKTNSFEDYTYIWWDLRPHPRLGTIEVRVCDAQTRIESVGAITALVQSLVATFAASFDRGESLPVEPITLVAENKWRAARDGLKANLIDLADDSERTAPEAVRALVEQSRPAAQELGCEPELDGIEALLQRGSGSDEQLAIYRDTDSLLAVAKWLAEETVGSL